MALLRQSKKRLVFTVTNDLNFDQRMIRICSSLQNNGYDVLLIGRKLRSSPSVVQQPFRQKRVSCFFNKGKLFYLEYNCRLFWLLLFMPMDLVCAIDLDTILPCLSVSVLRCKKRVYDAHELFCEMKEVRTRPAIFRLWKAVERFAVPKFRHGYTVNEPIRNIFHATYGVDYKVVMNVPVLRELPQVERGRYIIYQGAVNHGRSFETLIPAFQWIDCDLHIYGDGNFLDESKKLADHYGVGEKVLFKGKASPDHLRLITPKALMGITIFENKGLSNYYSLGNRFFDYMHACIPQLCVNYPAYQAINANHKIAVLISDLSPGSIADAINNLLADENLQAELRNNCMIARQVYNWQNEEIKLLAFYRSLFEN